MNPRGVKRFIFLTEHGSIGLGLPSRTKCYLAVCVLVSYVVVGSSRNIGVYMIQLYVFFYNKVIFVVHH